VGSFTSSSNTSNADVSSVGGRIVVRDIPEQPWLLLFAVAVVVVIATFAGWEAHVRASGFGPTIDDTPNVWAPQRARAVSAGPNQVVFVGSSRTLFDMNLEVFQQEVGGPQPIQLATVGSNPLIILEDLAADPTYAGTTIVGIVPPLVAAGGGPAVSRPKKFVAHYHEWTIANRMELPLVLWLDERFAFINEDLTLFHLIDRTLDLPLRPKVYAPKGPGYMYTMTRNRQARLTEQAATVPSVMREIQQTWLPLFNKPPRPGKFTQAEWDKALQGDFESNLHRIAKSVRQITKRGGKVIFSRLPSSGGVFQLEERLTPRAAVWDRIIRETGSPGIYFKDYPELKDFMCPEWSHLNGRDAALYTHRFARILKSKKLI
jgi:hypothetical protein